MNKSSKRLVSLAVGLVLFFTLTAESCAGNTTSKALKQDRQSAGLQLQQFQTNQPTPKLDWSQLRQNLIEIETAQARTTQTTSFFFNQGVTDPIQVCPSIGFPIPSNYQLTNPEAKYPNHDITIPQIEANGVYTADSTGTYVICVNAQGQAYGDYWEGFVQTVTGPAKWNPASKQVDLIGPPSFGFSTSRKK